MSATHQFSETNGVGAVVTDGISSVNMGNNDSANLVPSTYPVTAGENSFEKFIRAKFTGVYTEISNMKFWKSVGAYKTGEDIKAAVNQTYATPVKTTSVKATVTIPVTEGTALTMQSFEGAATIIYGAPGVSGYTGYLVLQEQTTVSTPSGGVNQKTLVMQYDEV
jgi:hypothetical protein